MRAVDLIVKKRNGARLTSDEIDALIRGYTAAAIPDYQMAAFLMAVYFQGMTPVETAHLTDSMIRSGELIDLSGITGPLVDKHSTGGVGDKVSLILAPIAAACGIKVPMMSGRSLGHTGGTLDKLESIRGYATDLSPERFRRGLQEVGYVMIGQSDAVVPADKRMYALRDVTGTVESIPLITASILSKKFAEGAQSLVLDVKLGSGAFMKDLGEARKLARSLVDTGDSLGRKVSALISDMDQPLGRSIGNFLEVREALACLQGRGPQDLVGLTVRLAARMLTVAGICQKVSEAERTCRDRIDDGSAWETFLKNVHYQGGDLDIVRKPEQGPRARLIRPVRSEANGFVHRIDAYGVGLAATVLGAGRAQQSDVVLPAVGIELLKVQGEEVARGEELCLIHAESEDRFEQAETLVEQAFAFGPDRVGMRTRVIEELDQTG